MPLRASLGAPRGHARAQPEGPVEALGTSRRGHSPPAVSGQLPAEHAATRARGHVKRPCALQCAFAALLVPPITPFLSSLYTRR